MRKLVVLLAIVVGMWSLLRRWFPVRVDGDSMTPALRDGDFLAARPLRPNEPRSHEIVVVHAAGLEMVKRVTGMSAPGRFVVTGDNAEQSVDSRRFGAVGVWDVRGRVRA